MKGATLIAIDVGNTATKIALVGGVQVTPLGWFPTPWHEPPTLPETLPGYPAFACSVAPGPLERVLVAWAKVTGNTPLVIGRDVPAGVPLDYETPQTLGMDRLLAAGAAWREVGAAIVVDAGSAITVDWIDASGTFRGGAIAPGLTAFGQALKHAAPGLELVVAPTPGVEFPGRDTARSLALGVTSAAEGCLLQLLARARRAAVGSVELVLTGGDGPRVMELLPELPWRHRPHLLFHGIALASGSCHD